MPFGVVSDVGISMGVLDFGGDRRREGAVWGEYNAEMHIDRLSTRVCKVDNISLRRLHR